MEFLGDGELPAELLGARQDPQVIVQLTDIFLRNSRHEDGAKRYLEPAEAASLARQALDLLFEPDGCQLAEVGGIRFFLEVGTDLYPGPNVIHANLWDGTEWRPVGRVLLPGGESET